MSAEILDVRISKQEIAELKALAVDVGNLLAQFGGKSSKTHERWLILLAVIERFE